MQLLKRHPFGVRAFFDQSLVLTFALPAAQLQPLLPEPIALDALPSGLGFLAVAMVQTRQLRPAAFPAWLGNDFFLAGYRIFTKYHNAEGKRLRGLYILESQTDSHRMRLLGNLMTHYNYHKVEVSQEQSAERYRVSSLDQGFAIEVRYAKDPALPINSPFATWREARRYAGPLPFTFTYLPADREVLIVQGVRQNWQPKPVEVVHWELPWLERRGFTNAQLASAFVVQNIPYSWKKGKLEKWPT
ncbi:MAG: DUF2071 domain-containing protein [Bacteroidota bacterium]